MDTNLATPALWLVLTCLSFSSFALALREQILEARDAAVAEKLRLKASL